MMAAGEKEDLSGPIPVDDGYRAENAPIALPSDRGLHLHHDWDHDAPQVVSPLDTADLETFVPAVTDAPSESLQKEAPSMCGLRRRTFWILLIVSVVIVGATVGGGVGGVMAKRSAGQDPVPLAISTPEVVTNTPTSSTTSPVPTSSIQSSTTSIPPTPSTATTTTNNDNDNNTNPRMEFSMQIWQDPAYGGRSQIFYAPGSYQTAFLARSYKWRPGQFNLDTMQVCSMAYCFGSNQLGWRGSSERQQPGYPENATWGADNIVIACAASFLAPPCPGPVALATFYTAPVIETAMGGAAVPASTATTRARTTTSM